MIDAGVVPATMSMIGISLSCLLVRDAVAMSMSMRRGIMDIRCVSIFAKPVVAGSGGGYFNVPKKQQ
jgi:hypothetical protein